jgi:cobyrinic acid a,c-diamide synthase
LKRRGLAVKGAKSGPDYIDPGFHAAATGLPGVNLDSWAMAPALLDALAAGTFDGAPTSSSQKAPWACSTASRRAGAHRRGLRSRRRYGLPALLVLDVSGQSTTAAAVAKGFATYDPAVRIAGVVLNRTGSERHIRLCREAIEAIGLPVVGAIPRNPDMALPERHLGLVQASEHGAIEEFIDRLADIMEASLDLERIAGLAGIPRFPEPATARHDPAARPTHRAGAGCGLLLRLSAPRAPLARGGRRDRALLAASPTRRRTNSCDACWLPGGYPELHAGRLWPPAGQFRPAWRHSPKHGRPWRMRRLHGAGQALEDADGEHVACRCWACWGTRPPSRNAR